MSDQTSVDLSHRFHAEYRSSGIALCGFLVGLATSELLWFYRFLGEFENAQRCQKNTWYAVVFTALVIFILTVTVQALHYFGLRSQARTFSDLERLDFESWKRAQRLLGMSDTFCTLLLVLAAVNLCMFLFYIISGLLQNGLTRVYDDPERPG